MPVVSYDLQLPEKPRKLIPPPKGGVSFNALLWTVGALTIGCIFALTVTAILCPDPTPYQQKAFDALNGGWHVGFGAMLGLLGAKNAR